MKLFLMPRRGLAVQPLVLYFAIISSPVSGWAQRAGVLSYSIPAYLEFSSPSYIVPGEPTNAVITIVRTGEFREAVSVNYSTAGGTASPGTDYLPVQGALTIPAGEGFATFSVSIKAGGQNTKTVHLVLSNPSQNGQIIRTAADLIIQGAPAPSLVASPALSIRTDPLGQVVISWPTASGNCTVQRSDSPAFSEWTDVNEPTQTVGDLNRLVEPVSAGPVFYRLRVAQPGSP